MIMDGLEIKPEDIEMKYDDVVNSIGFENFIKLCQLMGGAQLYFPKIENIKRPAVYRKIKQEFDGRNTKALAQKFNYTESAVREILRY